MSPFPLSGVSSPQVHAGQSVCRLECSSRDLCCSVPALASLCHNGAFHHKLSTPCWLFFPPIFSVLTLHQKRQWWGIVRIEKKRKKRRMGVIAAVKEAFEISLRSFAAAAAAVRTILLESGWNRSCLWKRHKSISGSYDELRHTKEGRDKRQKRKSRKREKGSERYGMKGGIGGTERWENILFHSFFSPHFSL